MGFPVSNLPSFDGQQDYMVVQRLNNTDTGSTSLRHCEHIANMQFSSTHRYYGIDISILRDDHKGIMAKVRNRYYIVEFDNEEQTYNVKHERTEPYRTEYQIRIRDPSLPLASNPSYVSTVTRSVQSAMYYAYNPVERSGEVYSFINILKSLKRPTIKAASLSQNIIQALLDVNENDFNRINVNYVKLDIGNVDVRAHNINAHINHTYVNVVYDCVAVCSQSVLSADGHFMSKRNLEQYGLQCTRKLLEDSGMLLDNSTTDTNHVYNSSQTCARCETCELWQITTGAISIAASIMFGSVIAIFVRRSEGTCAKAVRSRCSYITSALNERIHGIYHAINSLRSQRNYEKASISELLVVDETQ